MKPARTTATALARPRSFTALGAPAKVVPPSVPSAAPAVPSRKAAPRARSAPRFPRSAAAAQSSAWRQTSRCSPAAAEDQTLLATPARAPSPPATGRL